MATRELSDVEFTPLRPVSRRRMIVRSVVSPFLWLIAFVTAAIVFRHTRAIAIGLIVAFGSIVVSFVVLSVLHTLRDRERRRYADNR